MDAHAAIDRLDLLRVREVWQPSLTATAAPNDATLSVRRVGAHEHKVELHLAQRCRKDLDRRACVRAANSIIGDVDRTRGAHGQRLTQRFRGAGRPNGQDRDLAAMRLGQLSAFSSRYSSLPFASSCTERSVSRSLPSFSVPTTGTAFNRTTMFKRLLPCVPKVSEASSEDRGR